ncbi:MAG: alpha/beta hydrolase [Phycisphaerales bacterium]|nr:alpha/beta hydrolase [Phycisphaerales bacterium]
MLIPTAILLVFGPALFEPPTPGSAPTAPAVAPVSAPAAPAVAPAPKFTPNITYTSYPREGAPSLELMLNLAQPADLKPGDARPCIVAIHGGGWAAGKREDLNFLISEAAKQGFVGATISYRFAPGFRFPAQIEDCAAAVRFLKQNAEKYGLDPDRIGAIGISAGAHLAMLLAVGGENDGLGMKAADSSLTGRVRASVAFFGPTDLSSKDFAPTTTQILNGLIGADDMIDGVSKVDRAKKASPVTYVTKDDSPILMFFGTKDPLVPHTQAYGMLDAMTRASVNGRAEIIANEGHGFKMPEMTRTLKDAADFLLENMAERKATPPAGTEPAKK